MPRGMATPAALLDPCSQGVFIILLSWCVLFCLCLGVDTPNALLKRSEGDEFTFREYFFFACLEV